MPINLGDNQTYPCGACGRKTVHVRRYVGKAYLIIRCRVCHAEARFDSTAWPGAELAALGLRAA